MTPKKPALQLKDSFKERSSAISALGRRYEQLLHSEKYCDCVFHINGQHVKCHKLILAAASPVFEAMFYGPMCEEQSNIDILDVSADIFKLLVDCIYAGSVDFERLTLEETIELYYCAEKYLLSELVADCLAAIAQKLRFSNILAALELSVCLDLSCLSEICMKFFTRCCLNDAQFMAYLKAHYLHVSKECIKTIIAGCKDQLVQKQLLWFVYEWCQRECHELGLQQSDCALLIRDLQLQENVNMLQEVDPTIAKPQYCRSVERCYYKACRPFTIDHDSFEWCTSIKCDRFISLLGITIHSRLAPTSNRCSFSSEYMEDVCIQITAPTDDIGLRPSDGEDSDQEREEHPAPLPFVWRHNLSKQLTKYNCDLSVRWPEGVVLSPDIEYYIKLIWRPAEAHGAEYPCSLLSNSVEGIQFREHNDHSGSLIKGLRFINLL